MWRASSRIIEQPSKRLLLRSYDDRARARLTLPEKQERRSASTNNRQQGEAVDRKSPPQDPRKLLRHRLPMLRPFASDKSGPITRSSQPFAIRRAELELHRQAAFAEGGVFSEGEAFLELHLGFGGVGDVADFDRATAWPGDSERG